MNNQNNNWQGRLGSNERLQYENMIQDLTNQTSKLSQIIKNMEINPNQTHIIDSNVLYPVD